VVSWADRIAYVCHDFEDAVATGVVSEDMLPALVRDRCGVARREQLGAFIYGMIDAAAESGRIGMTARQAEALAEFRRFNYENIYLRAESRAQATSVINLLRALVDHFAAHPQDLPDALDNDTAADAGSDEAVHAAVAYVGGMTDRFACRQAITLLGWSLDQLPKGIDTPV
jgi:dGTPase